MPESGRHAKCRLEGIPYWSLAFPLEVCRVVEAAEAGMISDERCAKALHYLATTDEDAAELKTQVARMEYLVDLARKKEFLIADGNIEVRKALAESSENVKQAHENYLTALLSFEKIRSKRVTEELITQVWRSVNANRRQGGV